MSREILSQPDCWAECLNALETDEVINHILLSCSADDPWLFVGCGTSYYLALAAAGSFAAISGGAARAVPASEVLLFPDLIFSKRHRVVPVLISRSGRTTEVIEAQKLIHNSRGMDTIAISCASGETLAENARYPIVLASAQERSTVMTRSFSSMLLGLQYLAARFAHNSSVVNALKHMPKAVKPLFDTVPSLLQHFVDSHDFEDYAFLGQGPFYGVACEAALKVMESSCSYAQSFHSLEFRHGPKSIAGPKTLVGFFLSDAGFAAEVDLLEEIKSLGSATFVVTPRADARIQAAADFLVEIALDGPECVRLAACIPWAQLLGLYTGLKKGMNPDTPRNLSQVVILDEMS